VLLVTLEIERSPLARGNPVHRTAQEIRDDRRAAARRTEAALHILLVTLIWLVSVPFLLGWGLLGAEREAGTLLFAAMLAVILPFVGAVIATRSGLFFTGGVYAVLTLAMVLPAVSMVQAG
jgi:formate hydrogenlyase subunit 4